MDSNADYEVVVVGSGPAGSTVARLLAEKNLRVAVIEKQKLPRYKTCGGGLVRRAVRLSGVDLAEVVERRFEGAELHFHDAGRSFTARTTSPVLFTTMRDQFDHHMVSLARRAGARVFAPCSFKGMRQRQRHIEVRTDSGDLSTGLVIGADGALSGVARCAGFPALRERIPALEWEVFPPPAMLHPLQQSVRFDFGLIPSGYAWLFPKGEHLSMGVLQSRPSKQHLQGYMHDYLRRLGLEEVQKIERHGALIPLRVRSGSLMRERVLLVGDAAGLTDPLTCEGISFAIWSGRLAAQALLDSDLHPETAAPFYDRLIRSQILPELRLARLLAKVLYEMPRIRRLLFKSFGQAFCDAMLEVIAGERTYRELLSTPANYRRLFHNRRASPI